MNRDPPVLRYYTKSQFWLQTRQELRHPPVAPHGPHCPVLTWTCFRGPDSLPTTTKNIEADLPAKANCPTSLLGTSMYLKAACSDISVPRQRGGSRVDRCSSSIQQRPVAGTRLYLSSPTACLPRIFDSSRPREQQQQQEENLEKVLHLHSRSFQASGQPGSSMVYR